MIKTKHQDKFTFSTKIRYAADHKYYYIDDSKLKVDFIVDEKSKTTVCYLYDDNLTRFYQKVVKYGLASSKEMQLCKKYNIVNGEIPKIFAKTRCADDDVYDRNVGMSIALKKAKKIRYLIIKEIVREFQNAVFRNFASEMNMLEKRVENVDKILARREIKREKLAKKISQNKN